MLPRLLVPTSHPRRWGGMIPPWVAMRRPATRRDALHPIPLPGAWRGDSTLCSRTPELIKAAAAGAVSRGGRRRVGGGGEAAEPLCATRSRGAKGPRARLHRRRAPPGFGEGRESSPARATRPPRLQWKSRRRRLLAARATSDPGNSTLPSDPVQTKPKASWCKRQSPLLDVGGSHSGLLGTPCLKGRASVLRASELVQSVFWSRVFSYQRPSSCESMWSDAGRCGFWKFLFVFTHSTLISQLCVNTDFGDRVWLNINCIINMRLQHHTFLTFE